MFFSFSIFLTKKQNIFSSSGTSASKFDDETHTTIKPEDYKLLAPDFTIYATGKPLPIHVIEGKQKNKSNFKL